MSARICKMPHPFPVFAHLYKPSHDRLGPPWSLGVFTHGGLCVHPPMLGFGTYGFYLQLAG